MKWSRVEAICILIRDSGRNSGSVTSYRKVLQAIRALGLDEAETRTILQELNYHDSQNQPYRWLALKLEASSS